MSVTNRQTNHHAQARFPVNTFRAAVRLLP